MNAPFAVKAKHYLVLLHMLHAFLWQQSISTKKQWLVGLRLVWFGLCVVCAWCVIGFALDLKKLSYINGTEP